MSNVSHVNFAKFSEKRCKNIRGNRNSFNQKVSLIVKSSAWFNAHNTIDACIREKRFFQLYPLEICYPVFLILSIFCKLANSRFKFFKFETHISLSMLSWFKNFPTHFKPMIRFCSPWKHQNTFGFPTFSEGIEMEQWAQMG